MADRQQAKRPRAGNVIPWRYAGIGAATTVLALLLISLIYFAIAGRRRLVPSPQEEFALTLGEHRHPEAEGYGHTRVDEVMGESSDRDN